MDGWGGGERTGVGTSPLAFSPILVISTVMASIHAHGRYWPERASQRALVVEDISVLTLAVTTRRGFVIHDLKMMRGNEQRSVRHFWFNSWPGSHDRTSDNAVVGCHACY